MRQSLRITLVAAAVLIANSFVGAQSRIGDVVAGTCDGTPANTHLNEADIYTPAGAFRLAINGAAQNSCMTAMIFDAGDNLRIVSALFGTTNWNLLQFNNAGSLLATQGPFNSPVSLTHDQSGNLYLAAGSVIKIAADGTVTSFSVAGGAQSLTFLPDQHTLVYAALNGDVKRFDVNSHTQLADVATNAVARGVRALPDSRILINRNGAITRWVPTCTGCTTYRQNLAYQIPANSDGFALDPDGTSFWSINTFFDSVNQIGSATVYRTDLTSGAALGTFALSNLSNGRSYSGTIGVNGDGANTTGTVTGPLDFGSATIGSVSGGKTATVTNTGTVVMTTSNFAVTGDFAIKNNACAKGVLPGTSCRLTLTFSPTQIGNRTGTLKVFANIGSSPLVVNLSGSGQGASSTTLQSSLNPSTFGQSVTLTAKVISNGGVTPTGTVNFVNGTKSLGKATLSGGQAALTLTTLPSGNLSLVAKYSGDGSNQKSDSSPLTQTVAKATTTTTVVSSVNPAKSGRTVKFTATVKSPTVTPTGKVTFTAGSVTLGTLTLSNGKASVSTSTLPVGSTKVTATYAGTADIVGSAGSVQQVIQ